MTVSEIIWLARTLTHTTPTQVTDTVALQYLNIVYHNIENTIITDVNEDYFWDKFTTDLIDWQNEYVLQTASFSSNWVRKVLDVEVKYTNAQPYYQWIDWNSLSNFKYTEDYLRDNLSKDSAFFELREWSLFIYPKPTETVTNWLRLNAIVTLPDLAITDTEDKIFPHQSSLRDFHYLIAIGMKQYIYSQQREFWEKDNAAQEYAVEKAKMINFINDRYAKPVEWWGTPLWTNLMY